MPAIRLFFCMAMLLAAAQSKADEFYTLIGYKCDIEGDQLVLYFNGAYNDAGERMFKSKSENEWAPEQLVKSDKDGKYIVSTQTIERECDLSHGNYFVRLGPSPSNNNLAGMCGGHIGAWVEVMRGSEVFIPKRGMDSNCELTSPVTTKITISPKRVYTTMPADDFYQ